MNKKEAATFDSMKGLFDRINILIKDIIEEAEGLKGLGNLQVPSEAFRILRSTLAYGACKGNDKWWETCVSEQVEHALRHIDIWINDDKKVDYQLYHAFTRLMMASVIQHRARLEEALK